jgi:hypothetical protein
MHKILTLLLFFAGCTAFSQITGKITSTDGQGIPFVSVTLENTYTGTTANEQGSYELNIKSPGKYTLLFQSIGFKTKKIPLEINSFPHILNITLEDEVIEMEAAVVTGENPANAIIKNAIANKKKNSEKSGRYEADFYSKAIFRLKNVPKKIMGIKVDVPEGQLDSTGSGIVYLSETVSHLTFEQPDKLKEKIIASKISGDDSGFSYNTAHDTYYNFYDNYIEFDLPMVSPLANNAFNYYRYQFEGSFLDQNNIEINKIKVIPRRDKEPVFEGYIYIVEDSWAIYAINLDIKGYRIQQPILETLKLQQNFSYNANNGIWAKNSQSFDFNAGMFGVGVSGKVTHVYSNYIFHEQFDKKTFTKELISFEENANKKDSTYWNTVRPVPLTEEEKTDYTVKDSIALIRKSDTYKDSVLTDQNRFKLFDIIEGYSYRNPAKKTYFSYDGILQFPKYNTVQGWNLDTRFSFSSSNTEKKRYFSAYSDLNYGIAEDRLRVSGGFSLPIWKLGSFSFAGGNTIEQFNPAEPISPFVNTISSLIFKENYMKLYDNTFASISHSRWIFNGLTMAGKVQYLRRRPLFNNTDYVLIKDNKDYTSNDPLNPDDYDSAPFVKHELYKATVTGSIRFGQKYISRPDGKIPVTDANYPGISFMYEKAFSSSIKDYEYDFIAARVTWSETLSNKGDFGLNLKGGKFFNADNIAFMDYKHFNGNQTHIGTDESYLNVFNLLPYYSHSTNDAYFEAHVEHNFKGYVMNKIPLLDRLQWNLVVGYHNISTPDHKPYHEFTAGFDNVGFGKFRLLRIDYVRSYQGGFQTDGIIFGLKFLDAL